MGRAKIRPSRGSFFACSICIIASRDGFVALWLESDPFGISFSFLESLPDRHQAMLTTIKISRVARIGLIFIITQWFTGLE